MSKVTAKILVIEDEEPARVSLRQLLENEGFAVKDTDGALTALDMIKNEPFDILFVDYRLPDMNGIDLIRQASQLSKDFIPVIISGVRASEIAFEGMRLGVHDYVVKPANPEELLKIIETIILERDRFLQGKARLKEIVSKINFSNETEIVTAVKEISKKFAPMPAYRGMKAVVFTPVRFFVFLKRFFWDIR